MYIIVGMKNISKKKAFFLEVLIVVIVLTLILNLLIPVLERIKSRSLLYVCRMNIKELGIALQKYSNDHEEQYPTPSKWCDLLIEKTGVRKHKFLCKSAREDLIEWSNYAINPEAKPGSYPDIVLLFETERGWNQAGGPELISIKNHLSLDVEGCHVVFNDGSRKFVKPKHIDKLKWK